MSTETLTVVGELVMVNSFERLGAILPLQGISVTSKSIGPLCSRRGRPPGRGPDFG